MRGAASEAQQPLQFLDGDFANPPKLKDNATRSRGMHAAELGMSYRGACTRRRRSAFRVRGSPNYSHGTGSAMTTAGAT